MARRTDDDVFVHSVAQVLCFFITHMTYPVSLRVVNKIRSQWKSCCELLSCPCSAPTLVPGALVPRCETVPALPGDVFILTYLRSFKATIMRSRC
jgi:hypothetical protein